MEQMDHIEYFVNKIYKSLNIPRTRRDKESQITISNTIDIEKDEMKFFKFVLKLRRRFVNLFVDLLKKDLIAKKVVSLKDWEKIQEKIHFKFANVNPYSDIKKMSILQTRMEIAGAAMDMVENEFLSKTWIRREILMQTQEDIDQIEDELAKERAAGDDVETGDGDDIQPSPIGSTSAPNIAPDPPPKEVSPGPAVTPGITPAMGSFNPGTENAPSYLQSSLKAELGSLIRNEISSIMDEVRTTEADRQKTYILDSLRRGDVITNGTEELILRNGKLVPYVEE